MFCRFARENENRNHSILNQLIRRFDFVSDVAADHSFCLGLPFTVTVFLYNSTIVSREGLDELLIDPSSDDFQTVKADQRHNHLSRNLDLPSL